MKKRKIVSFCLTGIDIPKGKHCTLVFKPRGELRDEFIAKLGDLVSFDKLVASLSSVNVSCMVLTLEDETLYHGPSLPHITIEVKEGGKPAMSNDLINASKIVVVKPIAKFTQTGVMSAMYYNSDGKQYSQSPVDWE